MIEKRTKMKKGASAKSRKRKRGKLLKRYSPPVGSSDPYSLRGQRRLRSDRTELRRGGRRCLELRKRGGGAGGKAL